MTSERVILIGDVHGCFDELIALLDKVHFNDKSDRLIFLGDIINKGPKSVEVINFVMSGGHECVRGNHEQGFLNALNSDSDVKLSGGFKQLALALGKDLSTVAKWMDGLPYYIEEEDFIALHAGLAPDIALEQQSSATLTTIRTWDGVGKDLNNEEDPPWFEFYKSKKLVVFGHWAKKGLVERDNSIGLDTGCVWGGQLSALLLPQRKVISIDAFKTYLKV